MCLRDMKNNIKSSQEGQGFWTAQRSDKCFKYMVF